MAHNAAQGAQAGTRAAQVTQTVQAAQAAQAAVPLKENLSQPTAEAKSPHPLKKDPGHRTNDPVRPPSGSRALPKLAPVDRK